MSAATSPGPQNLLILAALGIGTYWYLTRRQVMAAPLAGGTAPTSTAANINAGANLLGALGGLFRGGASSLNGTADGRSATQWDVTPFGAGGPTFNNPSAFVSGGADGLVFNPVTTSAFDAAYGWEQYVG